MSDLELGAIISLITFGALCLVAMGVLVAVWWLS